MLSVDRHVYQVLTKRPGRALRFYRRNIDLFDGKRIPDHIWIGVSIENQRVASRADQLRAIPAATRFLSCEPLLGPLSVNLRDINWVIVGGESGLGHRPMDADWALALRDQCAATGVPFFFKQWAAARRRRVVDSWKAAPGMPIPNRSWLRSSCSPESELTEKRSQPWYPQGVSPRPGLHAPEPSAPRP
jgi:protein gp37